MSRTPGWRNGNRVDGDEWRTVQQQHDRTTGGVFCEHCGRIVDPHTPTRERRRHRTGGCTNNQTKKADNR